MRILHVDDNSQERELTRLLLERRAEEIEILPAGSAAAALETLESQEVDCIISDYHMPGMDGLQLLETLRGRHNETPFVFFTSDGDEEVRRRARELGAGGCYSKNAYREDLKELLDHIRKIVRKR